MRLSDRMLPLSNRLEKIIRMDNLEEMKVKLRELLADYWETKSK